MPQILIVIPLATSLVVTLLATPRWIRIAERCRLLGRDMNKASRPEIAEIGGVPTLLGFLVGVFAYLLPEAFLYGHVPTDRTMALVLTVSLCGAIGLVDDMIGWKVGLSQVWKVWLGLFASLPLVVVSTGRSTIALPLLGSVKIGFLYPFLLIPLGITGASNGFNMLAGYNGLEAKMGMVILTVLGVVCRRGGDIVLALGALCMAPPSQRSGRRGTLQLAVLKSGFKSGDIYVRPDVLSLPVDHLFRVLMILLIGLNRGIEVHGCGVVDNGKGMIFTGPSGRGKTTISNLWYGENGVTVLNDDRVIIRRREDGFWVYGTPWHGEGGFAVPDSAPLERIFFIRHAKGNQIIPKSGAEAASTLFARTRFASFDPSPSGLQRALDICSQLSAQVPCYDLGFAPDKQVVTAIRDVARVRDEKGNR